MAQLELNRTVFTTTIAKQKTFEVDVTKLPANALEKIIAYGVQRTFNDAVGGSDKTPETKIEMVEKLIADYMKGEIGRQPGQSVDPLTKEMRSIARAEYRKALTNAGKKYSEFTSKPADEQNAKLDEIIEVNREVIEPIAQKRIDDRKNLSVDIEV